MSTETELIEDEREVEVRAPGNDLALVGAIAKAELDTQITTARAFPRSLKRFVTECRDMACLSEAVAAECYYILPRGGKKIEGPSVRLSEIVLSAWGNSQGGARIVEEGKEFITAQGVFYDLERNVRIVMEVRRRITDKDGNRYNADMIGVTGNAACSIALRNAIFRGIPKAFWSSIYEEARKVAAGNIKSLVTNRTEALDWLSRRGVTNAMALAALGLQGVEDIGLDELATLRGMVTSVKEGTSVEEVFAPRDGGMKAPQAKTPTQEPKTKKDKGKAKNGEAAPAEQAAPAAEPAASKTDTSMRISLDQATVIADKIREEGVNLTAFLTQFGVRSIDNLPTSEYKSAVEWIDAISGGEVRE